MTLGVKSKNIVSIDAKYNKALEFADSMTLIHLQRKSEKSRSEFDSVFGFYLSNINFVFMYFICLLVLLDGHSRTRSTLPPGIYVAGG